MRIDFCCRNALVTENIPQRQGVHMPMLIHERCGGMPEFMRGKPAAVQIRPLQRCFHDLLYPPLADPPFVAAEKQRVRL